MTISRRAEATERAILLLEKGIDLVERRMIVGIPYMEHNPENDVIFPLAANFYTGLHALEHLYVPPKTGVAKEHIEIEFSSYGGDLYTSLGIFDRLTMVSVPVHMYVYGPCQSGGSLILQAATRRYISANSRLMLHYGSTSDEGPSDPWRMKELAREHEELMDLMVRIYMSRCNKLILSEEKLRKEILPSESYLNAEVCLRYGLADEIIEPELKF
jgi:ATP-dependent protease ClpP protease subunit